LRARQGGVLRKIVATYPYLDEHGEVLFEVVRFADPKDFRQRKPNGHGGHVWNVVGVRMVPFHLLELLAADPVQTIWVVEGEEDVLAAEKHEWVATCNPGGAGKWHKLDPDAVHLAFRGRNVNILPDHDLPGRRHAHQVALALEEMAAEVRIVDPWDDTWPAGSDLRTWLLKRTIDELEEIADHAPQGAGEPPRPPQGPTNGNGHHAGPIALPGPQGPPESHPLTDQGNAYAFAERYRDTLRYVGGWGEWYAWDGRRWVKDQSGIALRLVMEFVQERGAEPELTETEAKWWHQCQSHKRLTSIPSLAKSLHALDATPDQFDADPWILNVANGILDLQTGQLAPHDPARMCRKLAPVAFDPTAEAPRFNRFLDEVFPGDPELVGYLQRWAGYCLTGDVSIQEWWLWFGNGRNGKGLFLNAFRDVMGDYCGSLSSEVLLASQHPGHATSLTELDGLRLAYCDEIDDSRKLNEGLIKRITGGLPIKARRLYRDEVEFRPRAKLLVQTNYKPDIAGTDHGIWARTKLVEFKVRFTDTPGDTLAPPLVMPLDPNLEAALADERAGILAWAFRGLQTWRERRLTPAGTVAAATEQYRLESDRIRCFILERCVFDESPGCEVRAIEFYQEYQKYCKDNGIAPRSNVKFSRAVQQLASREGWKIARDDKRNSGNYYTGVRFKVF
jgi:putative DNA primase/helicase